MPRKKKAELESAKDGLAPAFERRVRDWRDKYVTRIERDMTTAFPQLKESLLEAVEENLGLVLTNKARKLSKEVIEPEVAMWIERTTTPIHDDAARELAEVTFEFESLLQDEFDISRVELMLLPAGLTIAGLTVIIGGFLVGITASTFLGIAIGTSVSWPIVVGGAIIGAALLAFGAVQLSHLKNKVALAFTKAFMPKLRSCLIGDGFDVKGEHHESVCRQFQDAVENAAEKILASQKTS